MRGVADVTALSPEKKPTMSRECVRTVKTLVVLVTAAIAALSACSAKNDGSEFVGRWEIVPAAGREAPTTGKGAPFEITKSGNSYVFGPGDDIKLPAIYDPQNHVLTVSFPLVGPAQFSYDSATQHVLFLGDEFQKAGAAGSAKSAQSAPAKEDAGSKLDKEALAFGKQLMTPHITVCDGRTFAILSEGDRARAPYLGEIKNPTFEVDSQPVSQADAQNGIEYHGTVSLLWETYRVIQRGQWTQWFEVNHDITGLSVAGSEQVYILHKNGQWMHDDSLLGRRDFAGMPRKAISCATVSN
jgi:hypothetical protein